MRILRIHNRYQERGGEDACFEAEVDLLRSRGHDVPTLVVTNDTIPSERSPLTSVKLAASTVWSLSGKRLIHNAIVEHEPDVVHFDNFFPLLSPSAYSACRSLNVPVVQTLHNYRLLCPGTNFFRGGHACEECLGKLVPWHGIQHGCYRESRAQTTVVASMLTSHRLLRTWRNDVDVYIALSDFSRGRFVEGGLPEEKILVKPNFTELGPPPSETERNGFLFVGRLSSEKGLPTLLRTWDRNTAPGHLRVIGDGPLMEMLTDAASRQPMLEPVGRLDKEHVLQHMHSSIALVFPSDCYENFPVTIAEAYASGLPVIASNHGAMSELVEPGRTGLHFERGNADDLFEKVRWASEHPEEMKQMGSVARKTFEEKYTADRVYRRLVEIYERAIQSATERRAGRIRAVSCPLPTRRRES